jgi:hypothetical protein
VSDRLRGRVLLLVCGPGCGWLGGGGCGVGGRLGHPARVHVPKHQMLYVEANEGMCA